MYDLGNKLVAESHTRGGRHCPTANPRCHNLGFNRKLLDGIHQLVDAGGAVARRAQLDAVALHRSLAERRVAVIRVPGEEVIQGAAS